MPVKIPDDLPAASILESENVFVMREGRANTQDIRPLEILILNLMPTKVETETQILRCLSNSPLQTNITLLQMASHESKNTSAEYLARFYRTFDRVRDRRFDGMIITGAPLETIEYEDVDYWEELCEIMDWTLTNVCSTLYICWGAMAGLYHHYGIQKRQMESKVSGIYEHRVLIPNEPIVRGFDDRFFMHIVCASEESGVAVVQSERNQTFITGHLEYDAATLAYEYERDLKAGKHPHVPDHYFEDDDPRRDPVVRWRAHATLFYTNWLNYCVYQLTPYDIDEIGKK